MSYSHTSVRTKDAYSHPGSPLSVEIDGEIVDVAQILERWTEAYQDPSFYPSQYFKIRALNKKIYILRYSMLFKSWWVKEYLVRSTV
ncbi:MAG: hypothetical protein JW920_01495 [Deltaproteobacteria bacterium]|nr:hypothetical protein [Deltaproteobacteria bacterium]